MSIIDTSEGIGPLPVGYIEPAEQILSEEETEPVHTEYNVGDLVQVTAFIFRGEFAKVTDVYDGAVLSVRLVFGDEQRNLMFWPDELKLIRRADRPGYRRVRSRYERPRIFKGEGPSIWFAVSAVGDNRFDIAKTGDGRVVASNVGPFCSTFEQALDVARVEIAKGAAA
jgi:hypothetical protein